jgi:hypothetical protein
MGVDLGLNQPTQLSLMVSAQVSTDCPLRK